MVKCIYILENKFIICNDHVDQLHIAYVTSKLSNFRQKRDCRIMKFQLVV